MKAPFFSLTLASVILMSCSSSNTTAPTTPASYRVSGKVTSSAGTMRDVTLTMGSLTTKTDSTSMYHFDSVANGSHSIIPSAAGKAFIPTSKSVTVAGANVDNVDFALDESSIPKDSVQMVMIPPGTFMMGTNPEQPYYEKAEGPRHKVTLTKGFLMAKYEVTQALWKKYMSVNPSSFSGDDRPVNNVVLDSVTSFCNRLSIAHGLTPVYSGQSKQTVADPSANGYRLPSEAEWEYVACDGDTNRYPGIPDSIVRTDKNLAIQMLTQSAWFLDVFIRAGLRQETQPVGMKEPNGYGLYDMVGNVAELCNGAPYTYTADDQTDPVMDFNSITLRVAQRGGCFATGFETMAAHKRLAGPGNEADAGLGVRLVRNLP